MGQVSPDAPAYPGTDWMSDDATAPPPAPPSRWARVHSWLAATVAISDALVALGLLLLGRGFWLVRPALGWIVPGAVLVWWALPQRPRFLAPKPPALVQHVTVRGEGQHGTT